MPPPTSGTGHTRTPAINIGFSSDLSLSGILEIGSYICTRGLGRELSEWCLTRSGGLYECRLVGVHCPFST